MYDQGVSIMRGTHRGTPWVHPLIASTSFIHAKTRYEGWEEKKCLVSEWSDFDWKQTTRNEIHDSQHADTVCDRQSTAIALRKTADNRTLSYILTVFIPLWLKCSVYHVSLSSRWCTVTWLKQAGRSLEFFPSLYGHSLTMWYNTSDQSKYAAVTVESNLCWCFIK